MLCKPFNCLVISYILPLPYSWFFDDINLNATEKLLLKKGNVTGTFLVRTIERPSAYYELLVRDGDNVNHYYIRKDLSTVKLPYRYSKLHLDLTQVKAGEVAANNH